MLTWLGDNWGTLLVGVLLLAALLFIVRSMLKKKSCCSDCDHCSRGCRKN